MPARRGDQDPWSCLRSRRRESATSSALLGLEIGVLETTDAGIDVRLRSPASCPRAGRCRSLRRRRGRHGPAFRASRSLSADEHRRANPIRRLGRSRGLGLRYAVVRGRARDHRMALGLRDDAQPGELGEVVAKSRFTTAAARSDALRAKGAPPRRAPRRTLRPAAQRVHRFHETDHMRGIHFSCRGL